MSVLALSDYHLIQALKMGLSLFNSQTY